MTYHHKTIQTRAQEDRSSWKSFRHISVHFSQNVTKLIFDECLSSPHPRGSSLRGEMRDAVNEVDELLTKKVMENSLKCHWTLKNVQTFRAEPFISVSCFYSVTHCFPIYWQRRLARVNVWPFSIWRSWMTFLFSFWSFYRCAEANR